MRSRLSALSQWWFPLFVLAVSLASTFFLWRIIDQGITERAEQLFENRVEEIASRLVKRLHDHEQVLLGGNALFHVKGDMVTRNDWRHYVSALNLGENHPGILGVGFTAWLTPAQKEAHIREIRAEGFPAYVVRPSGERPAYTSIVWLEPFTWRNQRAFGYDMYSEPVRRVAMDKARDTGMTTITGMVTLVQETSLDKQHGMLMYVPSYRQGMPIDTRQERRAALRGFVYSPIRMNDFVINTLNELPSDIDFEIHAGEARSDDTLMFSSRLVEKRIMPEGYRPAFSSVKTVDTFGVTWQFTFSTLPEFDKELNQSTSLVTLFTGILSSVLLSVLAFLQARSRRQALIIADQTAKAKAAAEEANRAKSEFLAKMSHEVRTPMTVVIGAIDHLLERGATSEQRPLLEMAATAAERLLANVNDVLDIAKIEARQIKIASEPFDLRKCVANSVDIFTLSAREKDLLLHWQVADQVPSQVEGDADRLAQVLVNLVGNAVKFTAQGEVALKVSEGKEGIVFEVRDTGIGIPKESLAKIFDPFDQGDSSRTRQYGGTGLGLAISKELVELMGGVIRVESDEGQGSKFTFVIPFRGAAERHSPTALATITESASVQNEFRS
jgi:signal transduction histidine kinase